MAFDINETTRVLGKDATEGKIKRKLLREHAKQQMNNYDLDEDQRKGYRAQYARFVKEDINKEENVFTRMFDKVKDMISGE